MRGTSFVNNILDLGDATRSCDTSLERSLQYNEFDNNNNNNFALRWGKKKKTCNNCFGMKPGNTTLHQVKIGKQRYGKIVITNKNKKNG